VFKEALAARSLKTKSIPPRCAPLHRLDQKEKKGPFGWRKGKRRNRHPPFIISTLEGLQIGGGEGGRKLYHYLIGKGWGEKGVFGLMEDDKARKGGNSTEELDATGRGRSRPVSG